MARQSGTLAELEELHRLVTKSLTTRIQMDLDDEVPTDAATLGAAIKMLKDNSITADPADKQDLKGLQAQLKAAAQEREQRAGKAGKLLELVKKDENEAYG